MIDDRHLHYLSFGVVAVGIEFLGACQDPNDFSKPGLSSRRFERGITDFMQQVDARYVAYNQKTSPFNLYKHLRCGMAQLCPTGSNPLYVSE